MIGNIKVLAKTYGFIRGEDGADYFFHDSDIPGEGDLELTVGDVVNPKFRRHQLHDGDQR